MKVAILVTSGGTFGRRDFYNRQEVGLARGLAALGHTVEVHKSVPHSCPRLNEDLGENCILRDVPSFFVGNHGWYERELLDRFKPGVVIMFTDLQFASPSVANWCKKNGAQFIPYVGTMHSNRPDRKLVEMVARRRTYRMLRRYPALAQNEIIAEEMVSMGVKDVRLMPFALDLDELSPPTETAAEEARDFFGITSGPVLGYVGQMMAYKEPLQLPELLLELRKKEPWQMALVGEGPLEHRLEEEFKQKGLTPYVHWKRRLPNREMWKLYCASDVLVNLNREEIVGVCILESLYYGIPVVAVNAPGPRLIIRDGVDGFLSEPDNQELAIKLKMAQEKIRSSFNAEESSARFSWSASAAVADQLIRNPS